MPENAFLGMDHDIYAWSAIASRPHLSWPSRKPVAFAVILDVSTVTAQELTKAPARGAVSGGLGPRPFPDIPRVTHRQYGHRVGIFRVVSALAAANVPISISLDALTASRNHYLARYCKDQAAELLAGGLSGSSLITSEMSPAAEVLYIRRTLDELESATGIRPAGWLSPEYSQSANTTALLADAGLRYVCDWVNDDQPYQLAVGRDFYSVPITYELDDVNALLQRRVDIFSYERMLMDALDCLVDEGLRSGRSLVLRLRPWVMGQPFRIGVLERFLEYAMSTGSVWATTPGSLMDVARVRNSG